MLATLTLVVLISSSEGSAELALHDAVQAVLGERANINVRVVVPLPSDGASIELRDSLGADAVAVVEWLDPAQRRAAVRVYRDATRGWVRREIEFGPADDAAEQGRTLGFAIASMLPEAAAEEAPPEVPSTEPPNVPKEPEAVAAVTTPPQTAPARSPQPRPEAAASRSVPASRPAPPSRASVELAASAAVALAGEGDRLGGMIGGELDFGSHFGLRTDIGLGAGSIHVLNATSVVLDLAPGISWHSAGAPGGSPFALDVRLSPFARYQAVIRSPGPGYGAEQHARWLPGARLLVGGLWWFSGEFAVLGQAGLDCTFGETTLVKMGAQVSSFEPLGLVALLGVRARL